MGFLFLLGAAACLWFAFGASWGQDTCLGEDQGSLFHFDADPDNSFGQFIIAAKTLIGIGGAVVCLYMAFTSVK